MRSAEQVSQVEELEDANFATIYRPASLRQHCAEQVFQGLMESKSSKELREPSLGTNWKGVRFQKNRVEQDSRGVMGRQVFQETARSKLFTKWKGPIPPSSCEKQTLHRTQGMHTTAAHGDHVLEKKKNCSFCNSVCHALVKSCCAYCQIAGELL